MIKKKFILCLLFFFGLGIPELHAQEMITVYPHEYSEALSNPMKGFRPDNYSSLKYPTLIRNYIKWNDIENDSSDGVEKIIDYCNQEWAGYEGDNIKIIPRVYLDWDKNSGNENWPADLETFDWNSQEFKDRVVNLIHKLGVAWDNDPRVAWVQTGIIGYWGEQENPVGVEEDGWAERMGKAFEDAFPNKMLLVRNQPAWDTEGFEMGVYWDSFAHPAQASYTWSSIKDANANGRYLNKVVEGEVAYNWGEDVLYPVIGSHPDATISTPAYYNYLIDVIREVHCSALGWVAEYNQNDPNNTLGAMEVQKAFGYRFIMPEFSVSGRAESGGKLDVSFKVQNTGSAPFYENWPLAFVLIDDSTKEIVWTETIPEIDIRTWLPGDKYDYNSRTYLTPAEEYEINASVTVPSSIPNGQYMAGVTILEPYSRTPGIFFAVDNFLVESQTQPLCRIGIGVDIDGGHDIDSTIFADPLNDDNRSYSLEWNGSTHTLVTSASTGGSISPGSATYPENRNVRLIAEAELGYEFSGWSGDLTGTENHITIKMEKDKSITANFTSVPTYTLLTNVANGSIILDPAGGVYNKGTIVTVRVVPDLGYHFTGWSGALSGTDNPTTITMDTEKNVTANFTSAPIYTLTSNAVGGVVELDPTGPQYTEGTLVEVKAIPNENYIFTQWLGDALDYPAWINPNYITMVGDKNITADFYGSPVDDNLLKNGEFTYGDQNWNTSLISPAVATYSFENKEFKVLISTVSDKVWHVNLMQPNVLLETDLTYTITFDARANSDKTINVAAQFDHDPWTGSLEEEVVITSSMQNYNVTWSQEEASGSYKVGFFFGSDTTDVWIDNVKLTSSITGVNNEAEINLPEEILLMQNYPNPFNPQTTIKYQLSKNTHVSLKIYNLMGELVKTLLESEKRAGYHEIQWNGMDNNNQSVSSGIYISVLKGAHGEISTKKMVLIK